VQCSNGHEVSAGQAYCSQCGSAVGQQAPPPPTAYTTVVNVQSPPPPSPGTAALILSILGFCGAFAIVGIIMGFAAIAQAKRTGASNTKGVLAVVIGIVWFIPLIIGGVIAITSSSTQAPSTSSPSVAVPSAAPSSRPSSQSPAAEPDKEAQEMLTKMGFTCAYLGNADSAVQCTKGTYVDDVYGEIDQEFVNFFPAPAGTLKVEGSVFPKTAKKLKKFGIRNDGEDGTGMGTVWVRAG
jgi:hypothetical protein